MSATNTGRLSRDRLLCEPSPEDLARVGLDLDEYLFFVETFVGEAWTYIAWDDAKGNWETALDKPLRAPHVIDHLGGGTPIGTGARWDHEKKKFVTRLFAVDLDYNGDYSDLLARYDRTCSALERPSFVVKSSDSGGFHLYYLLDQEVNLHQLRNADGTAGAVVRLLEQAGIPEQRGIEVYPRGKYAIRGVQNRLRLPCGRGSCVLDGDSLLPMARPPLSGVANLRFLRRQIDDGKFESIETQRLLERAYHARQPRPHKDRSVASLSRAPLDDILERNNYVRQLLRHGLSGAGEFNEAVTALAFDALWRSLTQDEANWAINDWLDRGCHNDVSRTWNRDPERARNEVAEVVRRIYESYKPSRWQSTRGVSEQEAQWLIRATIDGPMADPATGEALNRLKVQRLAFALLDRAKSYVLTAIARAFDAVTRHVPKSSSTRERNEAVLERVRHVWPDPERAEFVVASPYALRETVPTFSDATLGKHWRAVKAAGLFTPIGAARHWASKCETFAIRLDFGAVPGRHFRTVDQAVRALLPKEEIRRLYSRHHASRILRLDIPGDDPSALLPEQERFVVEQLRQSRRLAA
jgi:hypothetical protein